MLVLLLLNLKDVFKRFVNEITSRNFEDINDNTFTIYGEWCGGNIQKVWVFQIYQNLSLSLVLKFHKFKDGEEASHIGFHIIIYVVQKIIFTILMITLIILLILILTCLSWFKIHYLS
jgi:hypothetical protein